MSSHIEIVIESAHPQLEAVRTACHNQSVEVTVCAASGWTEAASASTADWIVLVDPRSPLSHSDIPHLAQNIRQAATPVRLFPWSEASPIASSVWDSCPPAIAVCWDNPVRFAAVCLQRSERPNLPAFDSRQTEVLWEWLTRAASRPGVVSWSAGPGQRDSQEVQVGDEFRLPALVPSGPAPDYAWLVEHITRLKPSQLVPEKTSEADSVAVKAGLLQWHDALDASHQLAQSIEGLGIHQAGDYWHAINHRREPDYSNAKYWFRQLGGHPIFDNVAARAATLLKSVPDASSWISRLFSKSGWDPLAFVDLCESCAGGEATPLGLAARQVQAVEMQLLLAATYQDASGKTK